MIAAGYKQAENYFTILHNIELAKRKGNQRKLNKWLSKLDQWKQNKEVMSK
jgi:hypothetical protein